MFASLAKPDEDIELHWLKVSLQLPFTRPGRRSPNSIAGHACGHTRSFREATSATERDALPWEMSQFASPPSVELRSRTCGIASGIGVLISVEPCEQPPTKITLSPGQDPSSYSDLCDSSSTSAPKAAGCAGCILAFVLGGLLRRIPGLHTLSPQYDVGHGIGCHVSMTEHC